MGFMYCGEKTETALDFEYFDEHNEQLVKNDYVIKIKKYRRKESSTEWQKS